MDKIITLKENIFAYHFEITEKYNFLTHKCFYNDATTSLRSCI